MRPSTAFYLLCCIIAAKQTKTVVAEVCAGCPHEADPGLVKEITPMVHQALQKHNANLANPHQLVKITRVTSQVVAGVKYTVDMETIGQNDQVVRECRMVLLSQPWISKEAQILSYNCQ